SFIKPKVYDENMSLGNKYLSEGKYEEAILAFDKAIKIDKKSTDARLNVAKCYICLDDIDKSILILKEAQGIDASNEILLMDILELLKDIDLDVAYDILQVYINFVGVDNISVEIENLLNSANEFPQVPVASPEPGGYISAINIQLSTEFFKVGHSYYYTIDGSDPSKDSDKYRGNIYIGESCIVKIIGFNKKGEATEVIAFEYVIDTEIKSEIDTLVKDGEGLISTTEVGTNVGNCVEGSKEALSKIIKNVKKELSKDYVSYEKANEIKESLMLGIEEFNNCIIERTDRSKLQNEIEKAQNIHDKSVEGNQANQYAKGSKAKLLEGINNARKIYEDILARQSDIDKAVKEIQSALYTFDGNKIIPMPKNLATKYRERLVAIEYEYDRAMDSFVSNAEMGEITENTKIQYEKVMNEIYIDLNKYLSGNKKVQFENSKKEFKSKKAKVESDIKQEYEFNPGTWVVTGEPGAIADVTKEHCYKLIDLYMN
ncbi:MAG: chitobiase/beta-hexosaminidase C-terminal domain-containing protein, partial [Peptostreptococcaceae bacterium]